MRNLVAIVTLVVIFGSVPATATAAEKFARGRYAGQTTQGMPVAFNLPAKVLLDFTTRLIVPCGRVTDNNEFAPDGTSVTVNIRFRSIRSVGGAFQGIQGPGAAPNDKVSDVEAVVGVVKGSSIVSTRTRLYAVRNQPDGRVCRSQERIKFSATLKSRSRTR